MPTTVPKVKVLFLCTGNSCRSQMAEGWARKLKGDTIESYSAGVETHGLNPNAVHVMAEAGVDISGHRSKHVGELGDADQARLLAAEFLNCQKTQNPQHKGAAMSDRAGSFAHDAELVPEV